MVGMLVISLEVWFFFFFWLVKWEGGKRARTELYTMLGGCWGG
jgi:hypothetical protein